MRIDSLEIFYFLMYFSKKFKRSGLMYLIRKNLKKSDLFYLFFFIYPFCSIVILNEYVDKIERRLFPKQKQCFRTFYPGPTAWNLAFNITW